MTQLRAFGRALGELFPAGRERLWFVLPAVLLMTALHWLVGSGTERSVPAALQQVGWAVLLLGLVPLLLAMMLRLRGDQTGLGRTDHRFGLTMLAVSLPLILVIAWFTAGDPVFRAEYPWPGPSVGASVQLFVVWALVYGLYYTAYEFMYRGFLQSSLASVLGVPAAIWIQTGVTFMFHLGKPVPELLASLPAGLLFGVLASRSGSILYPVLLHAALGIATDGFSLIRGAGG